MYVFPACGGEIDAPYLEAFDVSWFDLPRALPWLTGNIGSHHVHHLDQHVPNYWLADAHAAVEDLRPVSRLALWDETSGRLVRFRDARRAVPRLDKPGPRL